MDKYLIEAENITRKYKLKIDLENVILKLKSLLDSSHFDALVLDEGHGFKHALAVCDCALSLNEKDANVDDIALAAFLHDLFGVKCASFSREKHPQLAAKFFDDFFFKLIDKQSVKFVNKKVIELAIKNHGESVSFFESTLKSRMSEVEYATASLIRDADTMIEGMDIDRIIKITESYKRVMFNREMELLERFAVLLCEDSAIVESERCDLIMFLLRNVTKGVDPEHYLLDSSKKLLTEKTAKKNFEKIIKSIKSYKYPGDFKDEKEIEKVLEDVAEIYFGLKRRGLLEKARNIVESYSKNGLEYFNVHRTGIIGELGRL